MRFQCFCLTDFLPDWSCQQMVGCLLKNYCGVNVEDLETFTTAICAAKIITFCVSKATVSHVHWHDAHAARLTLLKLQLQPMELREIPPQDPYYDEVPMLFEWLGMDVLQPQSQVTLRVS